MPNLKKICESTLNLKTISFFHENPAIIDTAANIAAWLNHDRKEIKQALDYLVSQNILISHRTGSTQAFAYTQDKRIVKMIDKFLEKSEEKNV